MTFEPLSQEGYRQIGSSFANECNDSQGQQLATQGTKMNERHTFDNIHPQSTSHLIIKRSIPVVPVLIGPQIAHREREETHERYCRALLTLFVPWRSFDLGRTRSPSENNYGIIHDIHTFVVARAHHTTMLNEWKRNNEARQDETRNYLISGEDTLEVRLDETQIEVAPILVFRNTLRTHINNKAVLNKTIEMGLTPTVCVAQDYIQRKPVDDLRLRKVILELPDNKTEHLPGYLPLVLGMPVLLTENVATELGLSNGTRGIFRQLVYDESSEDVQWHDKNFPPNTNFITQPKYALVEFAGCKLDSKLAELQSKIVPIAISEQTFLFDAKELLPDNVAKAAKINNKTTKLSVKRRALPLIPAYSMTTHKSQGQTLGKTIVDLVMPPGPLEVASVYVPLSRVKRLDDLLIIRPFEIATLQVKPSTAQMEELNRLDRIAQNTRKRFQFTA
ncbi:unnamed protein product [Rotaria sp. Silwood2]|nr:unnamed protein product [Rotaria sp. Silwood2]